MSNDFLKNYKFDWDMLDVVINGKSALDAKTFLGDFSSSDSSLTFLQGYGVSHKDPIKKAELFGNFQEALQFIKRYFLKEGNKESGLDLTIPNAILMVSDMQQLVDLTVSSDDNVDENVKNWAEVVLKVVHTILHVDRDIRTKYFKIIQTQIFDKFYRYMNRNQENDLFLGGIDGEGIKLVEFDTKSKKSRDSVILKLTHKAENVAEELFDRVGVRFIVESKLDCLKVANFLIQNQIVIPQNIKPSRSLNTIFDLNSFKTKYEQHFNNLDTDGLEEKTLIQRLEEMMIETDGTEQKKNNHSFDGYKSLQFTCRQLITYREPFFEDFMKLKEHVKETYSEDKVSEMINAMDTSNLSRDIEFFYPYEVQIIDKVSSENNHEGDASHVEYKKAQIISARDRLFHKFL